MDQVVTKSLFLFDFKLDLIKLSWVELIGVNEEDEDDDAPAPKTTQVFSSIIFSEIEYFTVRIQLYFNRITERTLDWWRSSDIYARNSIRIVGSHFDTKVNTIHTLFGILLDY